MNSSDNNTPTTTNNGSNRLPVISWVGLVIALFGIPFIGLLSLPTRLADSPSIQFLLNDLIKWTVALAIVAIVIYGERASLGSIGLRRPSLSDLGIAFGLGVLALVAGILATGAAVALFNLSEPEMISTIGTISIVQRIMVILTAVITEEILWRGYPIERIATRTGSIALAAILTGAIFVAVHYPSWGIVGAIPQVVFTIALVGLYVWRRNLIACMVTHGVINTVMILVLPMLGLLG